MNDPHKRQILRDPRLIVETWLFRRFGRGFIFRGLDPVFLQKSVETAATDAQGFGGASLVTSLAREHFLNMGALNVRQVVDSLNRNW
jgi:hypothetical protein